MLRPLLCLFSLLLPVLAQEPKPSEPVVPDAKPEETPPMTGQASGANPKPEPPPAFRSGKNALPPKSNNYPTQYLLYVAESMKSFHARDFAGALVYADRADAMQPPTVWTLNVRGAVAIEQGKFEEGKRFCEEALKMEPGFFAARFNLAEIPFLQKDYASARKMWTVLYKELRSEDSTIELLIYRIYLTFLLEGDLVHAKDWLDKLPFPSQTPAYQYAHAAWERQNGRMEKWKEWIESAEFIWPQNKRASFTDVLYQLQWLKEDNLLLK